jgi:hypothetical protein
MEPPKKVPGARLCLSVTKRGVMAYGNPAALKLLAQWLEWIASQDPAEHFECHVGMDIENDESKFDNQTPSNVWVLFEEKLSDTFARNESILVDGEQVAVCGFDLSFMAVQESELDEMEQTEHRVRDSQ